MPYNLFEFIYLSAHLPQRNLVLAMLECQNNHTTNCKVFHLKAGEMEWAIEEWRVASLGHFWSSFGDPTFWVT